MKIMKRSTKVIIVIVVVAAIVSKFWLDYSHRTLDLEMDMCDERGNVVHVMVNAVMHRRLGRAWRLDGFDGEICFDNKVFIRGIYEEDSLVTAEFENSTWPDEWISSFSVADMEDGTYYFMVYQTRGESKDHWEAREDNTFHYFGPASTKEEAEKIRKAWVQKD